jgi:hypothetical protein
MNKKIIDINIDDYLDNHAMSDREIKISTSSQNLWAIDSHRDMRMNNHKKTTTSKEFSELQSQLKKGIPKSKKHAENIRKARLNAPPRTKETRKKISDAQRGNNKHCKPIITPLGIFMSLKEAGIEYSKSGLINATNHLRKRIKEKWDGYYYITKEEYILLTGKEL